MFIVKIIAVCFTSFLEHWTQTITYGTYTISFGIFQLTGETTLTAFEINVIEIHKFYFGASLLGSFHGTLQHFDGIPLLTWTSVDK